MDLDDVRIFTSVVSAGSFTRAAEQLNLPKSTVSRRVGQLEESLGVQLLHRTTRRLQLTEAGEEYFERSRPAIMELEDAARDIEHAQREPRGELRMTVPGDLSGLLPELLAEFQQRYPLVRLVVFSTGRRVDLLGEGYDLALRAAGLLEDSTLIAKKLMGTRLRLYASEAYLRSRPAPQRPEDLRTHECLVFSDEQTEQTWRLRGPEGWVEVPVRGKFATRNLDLTSRMASRGYGIALLPDTLFLREDPAESLVPVLAEYDAGEGGLYAVFPAGRHVPAKVRVFVDFISEKLAAVRAPQRG